MSQGITASVKPKSSAQIWTLALAGGILIVLGLLALGYLLWSHFGTSKVPGGFESAVPLAVDYPAPKLSLKDVNGTPVSLKDYSGQVVLVNNWAYWCPPCRAELPILERYYREHQAKNFVILGIESGSPVDIVNAYIQQYKLTYPVWLDPNIQAVAAFRNRSLPNSFVIDADGQVRLTWTGPISRAMLDQYVTPLLEK